MTRIPIDQFQSINDRKEWKASGHKIKKGLTAVNRVRRALIRLSRDKWLPPEAVRETAYSLASHCSYNTHTTIKHAYRDECDFVGMVRGHPILPTYDPKYSGLIHAIRNAKGKSIFHKELAIIKFFITNKT